MTNKEISKVTYSKEDNSKDSKEALYEGTVRVVTEADLKRDPRLVAASAVVGQLYDFSNLPYVKDGAIEADVNRRNEAKEEIEESKAATVAPEFTSEAERRELGIEPTPKDLENKNSKL